MVMRLRFAILEELIVKAIIVSALLVDGVRFLVWIVARN